MVLNEIERDEFDRWLRGGPQPSNKLLKKVELGTWMFPPPQFGEENLFSLLPGDNYVESEPVLVAGRLGIERTTQLVLLFRDQLLRYLLVRVQSWACYLNCNGMILVEHCEENLDAIRAAHERLNKRCAEQ